MACFHSIQARRLIRAVGGVEAASAICGGKPSAQMFSNYQNPEQRAFMPGHIIEALEREAGVAIYSAALVNLVSPSPSRSMLEDAMDAARIAGGLPQQIHQALKDGQIDQLERRAITSVMDDLRAELDSMQAALAGQAPLREAS